jgi:hypothetical protein
MPERPVERQLDEATYGESQTAQNDQGQVQVLQQEIGAHRHNIKPISRWISASLIASIQRGPGP